MGKFLVYERVLLTIDERYLGMQKAAKQAQVYLLQLEM